jgi:hypothetical protein
MDMSDIVVSVLVPIIAAGLGVWGGMWKAREKAKNERRNSQMTKESEVYNEVWPTVMEVQNAYMDLHPITYSSNPEESEQEQRDRKLSRCSDAINSFHRAIDHNRLFYPMPIFEKLNELSRLSLLEARLYQMRPPEQDTAVQATHGEKIEKNRKAMKNQIELIEEAMRERVSSVGLSE